LSGGGQRERWLAFLNNHREVIAAFDFFTVVPAKNLIQTEIIELSEGCANVPHVDCFPFDDR
jgi:hypothetical protein